MVFDTPKINEFFAVVNTYRDLIDLPSLKKTKLSKKRIKERQKRSLVN